MPAKKTKTPSPYAIYWEEVSTTTLKVYAAVVLVITAVVALLIYQRSSPMKRAQIAIQEAKELIAEVRKINREALVLQPAPELKLEEAQDQFEGGAYPTAYASAIESQRFSRELLGKLRQQDDSREKAYLIAMEGPIQVRRSGTATWNDAQDNMPLSPGDEIRTGEKASAQVIFFNGADYTVKSDSLIKIQESYQNPVSKEKKVAVEVSSGQVDLSTSTFTTQEGTSLVKISSPTSEATVGDASNALLSYDDDQQETYFSLYRGTANLVHGGQQFSVAPQQAFTFRAGRPTPIRSAIPQTPQLLSPAAGKLVEMDQRAPDSVTFFWSEVAHAGKGYEFQLSRTKLFANPLRNQPGLRTNTLAVAALEPGQYYWRVRAVGGDGASGFTVPAVFEVRYRTAVEGALDRTPPEIAIDTLVPFGPHILVIGRTEPGAQVLANQRVLVVNEDGSFRDLLTVWEQGRNRINFKATDPAGNSTTVEKYVYIETIS